MSLAGKALRPAVQAGLVILCLLPVGSRLAAEWGAVQSLLSGLQPIPILGAGLLMVVASLFMPVALARFTRGGPAEIRYRDSAVAYFASQPMKYLPGGFWVLPGRVVLLQRMGHAAALSSGGLLFEMAAQALAGALVGAALLWGSSVSGTTLSGTESQGTAASVLLVLAGSLLACGLLLASPALLRGLGRGPAPVRHLAAALAGVPLRGRLANLGVAVLALSAMWLLTGGGFYLLLVSGGPRLDAALLVAAMAVSTVAGLAGFLTPFSPGGLGVREAAIVLLLGGVASGPQATLVAILSRAMALVVEVALALAAWLVARYARSAPSARPQRLPGRDPVQQPSERGRGGRVASRPAA